MSLDSSRGRIRNSAQEGITSETKGEAITCSKSKVKEGFQPMLQRICTKVEHGLPTGLQDIVRKVLMD